MNIVFTNPRGTFKGIGSFENENKWVVKKGSALNPVLSESISKEIRNARSREGLIKQNILQVDVCFNSASMAAQFVAGYSVNGMKAWKTKDGESVSKIAKGKTKKPFSKK